MELLKRKNIRLKDYNYSQNGAYFVTICTHNKAHLFGEIVGEGSPLPNVRLNEKGKIVDEYVNKIPIKYTSVKIDKYATMPNHIHMIIAIVGGRGNPSPTIGNIIGWFKYQTTKIVNELQNTAGAKLWQRSYHDHIIRNEQEYLKIWQYIDENPQKWDQDCYYIHERRTK